MGTTMRKETFIKAGNDRTIIKKCHVCGHMSESQREICKCLNCKKSFLPLNYFGKVHARNSQDFENLFVSSDELNEDDLIKGINVLW